VSPRTKANRPRCRYSGRSSAAAWRAPANAQLFDFRLSDEDIAELDALDRTGGTDRALERKWWRS